MSTAPVQSTTPMRHRPPAHQQQDTPYPFDARDSVFSPLGSVEPSTECPRRENNAMYPKSPVREHGTGVALHTSHSSGAGIVLSSQTLDRPASIGAVGARSIQPPLLCLRMKVANDCFSDGAADHGVSASPSLQHPPPSPPLAPDPVWHDTETHHDNSIPDLHAVDQLFEGSAQATERFAQTLDDPRFDDDSDQSLPIESNINKLLEVLQMPIRIEYTESDWISKAIEIWYKEFPDVSYLVGKSIKQEWVKNWRSAQMFATETSSYRQFLVLEAESKLQRKRHRRDRSDASNDERPGTKRRVDGGGSTVSESPVGVDRCLNALENAQLTNEQVLVLERLLRQQRGEEE